MTRLRRLWPDRRGNAAVEMALVFPLLLIIMFGSFELGNFFLSEHVVQKSVRDAARYGARLPLTSYPSCASVDTTAEQQIQRLARTGLPDGQTARLAGWTADSSVTVSVACDNTTTFGASGIYSEFPNGAPVLTVSATVPYRSVLAAIGFNSVGLNLNARSQAAVIGA